MEQLKEKAAKRPGRPEWGDYAVGRESATDWAGWGDGGQLPPFGAQVLSVDEQPSLAGAGLCG